MNIPKLLTLSCLLLSLFPAAPARAQEKSAPDLTLRTVVIDPGHGGKDTGTISADKKTYEKTLTLKISRLFADKIRAQYPDVKVLMTRDKDVFIPLNTRAKIASDADAQLFISIHINAMPPSARAKTIHGFSAYILGPSKSNYDSYEVNLNVCKRENSVIFLEDDYSTQYKDYDDSPESQILLQLMQNAFREQSLAFAEAVSSQMKKGPFQKSWGVMQDNFAVLRRASMPAVLLEFGFMTNAADLETLRSETKLAQIADRLYDAFVEYKTNYDKSVALGEKAPKPQQQETSAAQKPEAPAPAQAPAATQSSDTFYGTQILATARKMQAGDKFFKGLESVPVQVGSLYKYIALPDPDRTRAKENYARVKKIFPDAFFVKVENGQIQRIKP